MLDTIDIGRRSPAFPVTPPYVRVRIRRFGVVELRQHVSVSAELSVARDAGCASAPSRRTIEASPLPPPVKASSRLVLLPLPATQIPRPYSPLLTVRAFGDPRRLLRPLLTSAPRVGKPHGPPSPSSGTRRRPPEVSPTAFCAQPPDLRSALLMDTDFAVIGPLVQRSRLLSGSCPSAHAFAPRFLQTPPHDDALALR